MAPSVGGIFCIVSDQTGRVLGERRLRTLRELGTRTANAKSAEEVCRDAAAVLAADSADAPFALLYLFDGDGNRAELASVSGVEHEDVLLGKAVVVAGIDVLASAREGRPTEGETNVFVRKVPEAAAERVLVLPVLSGTQVVGALVVGVSRHLRLAGDYRDFFDLAVARISAAITNARAYEEERRRAEALTELDRAKTAFFSNVSHEFRTPLTLMIGPLEDLLASSDSALPEAVAATLDVAHRNSLRLLKLVNTLLDFSRIEAGRIDANYEPTDLAASTAELASVFRSAIEKADLRLVVDCAPLPHPVYVDRDMWEKIVLNLLSNAFKYTFEGAITVGLRWRGERVELCIADTGIGIPERDLPRVFERFHRVKDARGRTHEGTGIGLALVQELARLHGGAVSVQSKEGRGSTFVVSIRTGTEHLAPDRISTPRDLSSTRAGSSPYVDEALRWLPTPDDQPVAAAESVIDPAEGINFTAASGAPARVLLADDNADMRNYLSRILGQRYRIEAVSDGTTALERIRADPPDLVMTDVMMPGLDGFGLLNAIRADERSRAVPVILLSARAGEEARIEGLRAGADEYMVKPFSARELLARVDSQLELARVRREAEQALRYRSEQHETLLNQAPLGVYVVDADFRIREANPVARPVFGDIPGGVIGRNFGEIVHMLWETPHADELVRIFRTTLATGEPYVAPEWVRFRIDRRVTEYYEWRVDRITLPDGHHGLVCYFRDISAQIQARLTIAESERQLREADRRKDEFLALLAHELRNPLAPIRTGLELIRVKGDTPDAVRRVRSMMERQVGQMVRLIDELLDVSRITSGKMVLKKAPTAFTALVQSAIDAQRAALDAANLELTVQLPERACIVDVDPTRLVQVLSNVIHNAVKFTPPKGEIRVSSTILANESGARELIITVSDTGIGISREMLPRVFELFTQGEQPAEGPQSGLGIGLALARRLVEMHGGRIDAHSEGPGRGSAFVIRLPVTDSAAVGPRALRARLRPIRTRVVIIDDNHDAAETMAMLIQEFGGSARIAHAAVSGLETVKEFQPDVVFLDIGMPGIDGYETCRRIRRERTERPIFVVAVTGWGQSQDKQRALDAGFDAHLTKPVDPAVVEELLAANVMGNS
jgi:PAS domain S-box-containing protein